MDQNQLRTVLNEVYQNNLDPDTAISKIHRQSFEDIGFAKIDHHRSVRQGFPEVVFCQGKTPAQVSEIFSRLTDKNDRVLATRADKTVYESVKKYTPQARYNELAQTIVYQTQNCQTPNPEYGQVAVVSAGTSDLPVAKEAVETSKIMGAPVDEFYDVGVAGIHRLLHHTEELSKASCVVVAAGMEGALASVVGGIVDSPVIACPTSVGYGASFNGLSALLTMLNSCATGVSVVNIDNGFGAGYQAALISRLTSKSV